MAIKGVNMFEQHVEKIVLALAVAAAAYMGYAALQKPVIEGTEVGPGDVEPSIATSLSNLKNKAGIDPPALPPVDFPKSYRELSQSSPIDDASKGIQIVNAAVPMFGPRNLPLTAAGPSESGTGQFSLIAPDPVAPEDVQVQLWEGLVTDAAPAAGDGAAPAAGGGKNVQTRDQSAAVIEGFIPVGQMVVQMGKVAQDRNRVREAIPENWRFADIYRIRVQRRERTPTGWGDFKDVPATKATTPPTPMDFSGMVSSDVPPAARTVEKEFKQIALPNFYPDGAGAATPPPILSRQPDKKILDETTKLQNDMQNLTSGGGAPGVAPEAGGGGAAAPGAAFPADAEAIRKLPVVPFTFWDETVQPNHVYQYQVEVDFLNPLYKWTLGLQNPAIGNQEVLTTGWVTIPTPVVVNSDLAFFIHGSGGPSGGSASPTVTTRVYKKSNGKWYWSDFTTPLGTTISGQIPLVDKPNNAMIDVDTGFTIVDADVNPNGNDVHVILKDTNGDLISRDSAIDREDPNDKDLYNKVVKRQVATSTAPATQPGEGSATQPSPTRGTAIPRPTPRPASRPARGG